MADMVCNTNQYAAEGGEKLPLSCQQEQEQEHREAFRIIQGVCDAMGLACADIQQLSLLTGLEWDHPGSETINLSENLLPNNGTGNEANVLW